MATLRFAAFPAQEERVRDRLGGVSGGVDDAMYAACWDMFADPAASDYRAGVAVEEGSRLPDNVARLRLPAQRYAILRRAGDAASNDTARAIWEHLLPASDHTPLIQHHPRRDFRRRN